MKFWRLPRVSDSRPIEAGRTIQKAMLRRRDPVEEAREALGAGAYSRVIRCLWRGSTNAAREVDAERLEAFVEIAKRLADVTKGRRQEKEALTVFRYATRCLEDARQGLRPQASALGQLFDLSRRAGRG